MGRHWFLQLLILGYGVLLGYGVFHLAGLERDNAKTGPKTAVILAVNDVYRINGIADGRQGGIARLRSLRAELETEHPDLLMLHGGDLLAPSFLSRSYAGQQMIAALNLLDGKRQRDTHDDRLFVVFGNHEFDETTCSEPGVLRQRVLESEFNWLATNIDFADCHGEVPLLPAMDRVQQRKLIEVGGLKVGLFGLTIAFDENEAGRQPLIRPYEASAREQSKALRGMGADVVIALTHLNIADDLKLLADLGDDAPDVIVGGHDHSRMALPASAPRVFKADADALTASVFTITLDDDGKPVIEHRFEMLAERITKDPLVQQVVDHWLYRHAQSFCGDLGKPATCLDEVLGSTKAPIDAEELKNRGEETGIGNWIADVMLQARADADLAILNSGTLRLNYDLPGGSLIRERHVQELFGFPVPLLSFEVSGEQVWTAVENAVSRRGSGGWAHLGGVSLALAKSDDGTDRLERLLIQRHGGGTVEEIKPDSQNRYRLVTSTFLACGGDGYDFGLDLSAFDGDRKACMKGLKAKIDPDGPTVSLPRAVATKIDAATDSAGGIDPKVDNRICEAGQSACLISDWAGRLLP